MDQREALDVYIKVWRRFYAILAWPPNDGSTTWDNDRSKLESERSDAPAPATTATDAGGEGRE